MCFGKKKKSQRLLLPHKWLLVATVFLLVMTGAEAQSSFPDWGQVGADIDGESLGDESGHAVSLSGDSSRVAIGSRFNSGSTTNAGHIRVFEYNSSTWVQLGADIDGELTGDYSGRAVSLSADGTRVAIGAHLNDGGGSDAGHVRVFEYNSSSMAWVQLGADIDGEAAYDENGYALSISAAGDRVAIGARFNDGTANNAGRVRVFEYDSSTWVQLGGNIDGKAADDESASAIALSSDGNRVAIGAKFNDGVESNAGHVRVFEYNSSTWVQVGADMDNSVVDAYSGAAVALSYNGSRVAISARLTSAGVDSGQVRVFDFNSSSSSWMQLGADIEGEAAGDKSGRSSGDGCALSLSADGYRVAVGASLNDAGGNNAGHVRIFDYDFLSSSWVQMGADIDGDVAGGYSGHAVSLSSDGDTVAIGAQGVNNATGQVRVWQLLHGPSSQPSGQPTDQPSLQPSAQPSSQPSLQPSGQPTFSTREWYQVGGSIDGDAAADFGGGSVSVSLDGSRVAVGTYYKDINGTDHGVTRVYAYAVSSSSWEQLGADINASATGDRGGGAVSLSSDGTRVAIGAPYNDDNGTDTGHVRVYEYSVSLTAWVQLGETIEGGSSEYDHSGSPVSLSSDGSRLAIGAPYDNVNGTDSGYIRVFEYNSSSSAWMLFGGGDGFAASLSSDGTRVAIGVPFDNAGHVKVFEYNGNAWQPVGVNIGGESAGDLNGYSVSLSLDGSRVAIGATGYDDGVNGTDAGQVRVFEYDSSSTAWVQLGAGITGEATGDLSGYSLSLSSDGSRVAIGAPNNAGGGYGAGHVRIYDYDSLAASWVQMGVDLDGGEVYGSGGIVSLSPDGSRVAIGAYNFDIASAQIKVWQLAYLPSSQPTGQPTFSSRDWMQVGGNMDGEADADLYGWSVSLSADGMRVAIGAILRDSDGGVDAGYVHVFELDSSSTWTLVGTAIHGEEAGDNYGRSVSLSSDGDRLAIGASRNNGTGTESGYVQVFEFNLSAWVQLGADIDGEAAGDQSGFSVSLSADGTRVAVGALLNDGGGSDAGHVRVYEYNFSSTAWVQLGADIDGEAAGDGSGRSVSLSSNGHRLATSAIYNDRTASDAGHVRVFEYDFLSYSWIQLGSSIDGEAENDQSGFSVCLSSDGSRVAIGATYNDNAVSGNNAGHVRVYQYDTSSLSWVQLGADLDGEAEGDMSGWSVSLSSDGSRVAIGSKSNFEGGINAGHVRIYDYDLLSASWIQMGADIDGAVEQSFSGSSVSLSADGSRVAIGAYKFDSLRGQVRVWQLAYLPSGQPSGQPTFSTREWYQVGADIDGEAAGDQSGFSVSLSEDGTRVAIGAPFNDGSASNAGHVRVFEYDPSASAWAQLGDDIDGELINDYSGGVFSLSSDGACVAISAVFDDGSGSNAGHVRVYEYNLSAWVQLGADIDGEAAGDESGSAVSLSSNGTRVAIGSALNDGGGSNAGHVRVYQFNSSSWVQLGADIDGEASYDESGSAVSLSSDGTRVAIGSHLNDDGGSNAGHVRVYEYNLSAWVQLGADIDGEASYDESGSAVSLSSDGTRVAIGSYLNDDGAYNAGHVRVFEYDVSSTSWVWGGIS
jgi:hypothetical protein